MNSAISLIEELPLRNRLALSYAPERAKEPTLALLAFDLRMAAILRAAKEPMLAQLRITWWREQMKADPATWPSGDPLLTLLRSWGNRREALIALAEGWEGLTAPAPLPEHALSALAEARGGAFAALADVLGASSDRDEARRLGANWALADMAGHLSNAEERRIVLSLAEGRDWRRAKLSRPLRPLAVLHALAARGLRREAGHDRMTPGDLAAAMRIGLLGV